MNKYVLLTAVLGLATAQAFAQGTSVDSEVDAEIDQMYSTRQTPPKGMQQPVYIVNQSGPSSQPSSQAMQQVQKQPTTYIEAAPLNKSRADEIREARQQVEADTESRIVEKLEQSRIEDEKRRANVLFGEKFDTINGSQSAPVQQPVVVAAPVAPAPVVVAAPVEVEEPQENTRDVVREEIRAALDAEKAAKPEKISQKYFSGLAGMGDYPDVQNVRGNYLLGATFGTRFEDTYAVEGSFIYSNYTVQRLDGYHYLTRDQYGQWIYVPGLVDVQQYAAALAVKFYLMSGMVKPILGGLAQYSHRTFSWSSENYGAYSNQAGGDASSQAIDVGVITGVDFDMSEKFSVGLDFRYLFNLNSRITTNKNSYFLTTPSYGTPIEKLQYYNLSLAARVNF